ncbi:hypothetical protein PUN28_015000 [Cardiocondyla obscurior]|uniref:Uncharacterized protein n=1 Tax=Cardiocondyla obscurior TaxID=286306 RepID=A0AAW2EYP4_9HYME
MTVPFSRGDLRRTVWLRDVILEELTAYGIFFSYVTNEREIFSAYKMDTGLKVLSHVFFFLYTGQLSSAINPSICK